MTVKERIVELFDRNKGKYLSGEELANTLSVSRNAVWKAVKSLQQEGYDIIAVPNKGYCLSERTDILSHHGIAQYLNNNSIFNKIEVYKTIDSTNTYLKNLASKSAPEGTVVISEEQTAGKGRIGRAFFSPANSGIYMSILLKPSVSYENAHLLTALAAVCVSEAIETVSDKKAHIKWVNDIFIDNKKVCGILTEAAFNMENLMPEYVVIGIGINVFYPNNNFPAEIENIATSIFDREQKDIRNRLSAEILNRLANYQTLIEKKNFIQEYRRRSCLIGKAILVEEGNVSYFAKAIDIDDDCRLLIKTEYESIKTLSAGEVSIKMEL